MAYNPVPATQVSTWLTNYRRLKNNDLRNARDDVARQRAQDRMDSLVISLDRRLTADMRTVHGYFEQHLANADRWAAEAQQEVKDARATAASYRKNPAKLKELPTQLDHAVKVLRDLETAIDDDGNSFGAAWFGYRGLNVDELPEVERKRFQDVRTQIMNDSKIIASKRETILAAKHEAEALVQIAAKAKMKAGIKAKTGAQRPLNVAQQAARDLAIQAAALFHEIDNPQDGSSPPQSVRTSATNLDTYSKQKTWYQTPTNLSMSRGLWKSLEAAYKNLTVKTAGLEKTVAAKTRAFRTNELSDPVVKVQVANAAKNVKDAKKLVSLYKPDYEKGKKALARVEAGFKKK